ncbi:fimbrial protein [Avibacterium paragallinarum]|nr:fimbrial protein [Avibacterium paragallinarum]MEE3608876.1 fimbrial protein [Avibacterium paragallinarum]MEE3622050.1 fimbrial protein [Avibacterium paragallinarum]MEE3669878.1 fimbrial protein [Avibacterium paragallinarum]MEE3680701.1 fimbrial protein [Avibacterium paragallinarum]MEE4386057.1 fimbrial protein [Avibacterium paragallinarum]
MNFKKYLLTILMCSCMSVNAVQKMVAIMPQVDLVLGDKTVNIARDRGDFRRLYFTSPSVTDPYFFNNVGRGVTSTVEVKVVLENLGIYSINGNPLFRVPNLPDIGIELMIYDRKGEKYYPYTDKDWHEIFRWGPNHSNAQGLKAFFRLVMLDTPEARVYSGNRYSLDADLLVGYVRSRSYSGNNLYAESDEIPVYIKPFTLIRNIASCTYRGSNFNVPLPTVNKNSFRGNGSEVFGGTFVLNLDQCGVLQQDNSLTSDNSLSSVWVTFTDATNPDNRTGLLTLTQDSSAQGVKLKIYPASSNSINQNALHFGADSRLKGNENAKQINYSAASKTAHQRYIVKYVQDGSEIIPGSVNAIATFTFSYQ